MRLISAIRLPDSCCLDASIGVWGRQASEPLFCISLVTFSQRSTLVSVKPQHDLPSELHTFEDQRSEPSASDV